MGYLAGNVKSVQNKKSGARENGDRERACDRGDVTVFIGYGKSLIPVRLGVASIDKKIENILLRW